MRFNVGGMRRQDVDDVLVAFSLATRVSHETIIVISDDDVKRVRGTGVGTSKRQEVQSARTRLTKRAEFAIVDSRMGSERDTRVK